MATRYLHLIIDLPKNGYELPSNEEGTWADGIPWYFDEYEKPNDPTDVRFGNTANLLDERVNGTKLEFEDYPGGDQVGSELDFLTYLVGDFGNQTYDFLGGFEWSTRIQEDETTKVTRLEALDEDAELPINYQQQVLSEFGFTRVPVLHEYRGYYTDNLGGLFNGTFCGDLGGLFDSVLCGGIGGTPSGYAPNDDGSFGVYPLGFSLPFFGNTYNSFYQIGQGEWDSENYLGHAVSTYVNLYDFAKDSEVKSIAKAALDWYFTSGAVKYWRGAFGGPSKRDYSQGNCTWCSLATHELGLHFGDSPIGDSNPSPDSVHLITSSYRPPAAVVALARKQFPKPVELLNSKPTYENWKPGGDSKPQFHETLYFGHTFQLGTLAQGSGGDWNGFKMMAFNKQRGVDYFIAATGKDPTQISTSSIGGDNVAQYRNLVIWLNGKPSAPFQFFLPKSVKLEASNGITFIQYEKSWLALTPINLKVSGINTAATEKIKDRYPNDQIVTATGTSPTINGFALEVGEQETHKSWEQFKQSVVSVSRLNLNHISDGIVSYQGVGGKVKLQYQDKDLPLVWRNGQFHDWHHHYKVYQNATATKTPIYQGWKEGKLLVEAGGYQFQTQP